MKTTLGTESAKDEQLVEWSLTGDREAFGRIVERYQSLVCSITYSATGSLSLSEDLAQETFVTAWRQLVALRDATKLRGWLCGIARNLTNSSLRRGQHEPTRGAEPLEAMPELPATEPSPSAQAVSREEETILWRAIERIPDTYREPMILFYREQQSLKRVAEELELSEDAVKQRLARGRKLLAEEVAVFVESTLQRTTPGHAFTLSVVAALPLGTASATMASAGVAVKSGGVLAFFAALLAPVFGLLGGIVGTWGSIRAAETRRERRFLWRWMAAIWLAVLGVLVAHSVVWSLRAHRQWSDETFVAVQAGCWTLYAMIIVTIVLLGTRRGQAIRKQEGLGESPTTERGRWYSLGRVIVVAGVTVGSLGWMIGLAVAAGDRLSVAVVAMAIVILTAWAVNRVRSKTGAGSEIRALLEMVLLIVGTTLVMVNWRLHAWIATTRGVALAEIQRSMPLWSVNLFASILAIWVGLLLMMTRPKGSRQSGRSTG